MGDSRNVEWGKRSHRQFSGGRGRNVKQNTPRLTLLRALWSNLHPYSFFPTINEWEMGERVPCLQKQIFPATHRTRDMTTSWACLIQSRGGSGTEWWLTCEIMWLFKDGCCWGVGGRTGSCCCCCCCWAVQGRRPRTDWDEVTWLHTSGAPSAIPKAKRKPTKSYEHKS